MRRSGARAAEEETKTFIQQSEQTCVRGWGKEGGWGGRAGRESLAAAGEFISDE